MRTINTREIYQVLNAALRVKKSLFISGGIGIGKTSILYQVASKMLDDAIGSTKDQELIKYYETLRGNNVVDIRLATETPVTIKGTTVPEKLDDYWVSQIAFNSRYPRDPRWVGVILFDELTSAPPNNQTYAYQALNERCIDSLKFPEGALVVASGNRVGDGGIVYELPQTIMNRVRHFDLRADGKIWVEDFGIRMGIHSSILSLISTNTHLIDTSGDRVVGVSSSFATPRSWEDASESVYDYENGVIDMDLLLKTLEGTIGERATSEWRIHYDIGANMPSTQEILEGMNPVVQSDEVVAEYYIAFNCNMAIKSHIKNNIDEDTLTEYFKNMTDYFINVLNMKETNRDLLISVVLGYEDLFKGTGDKYPMFVERKLLKIASFRQTMQSIRELRESADRNGIV